MTEEEAREALIALYFKYINNPPKVRLQLYDEYRENRAKITAELKKSRSEGIEEIKTK